MAYEVHLGTNTKMDVGALSRLADPDVRFLVGSDVWTVLEERRRILLERMAQGNTSIYGANTGVGAMKAYRVPRNAAEAFNNRLMRDHAAGFGPLLDRRLARLMMAIRIVELAQGGSGISVTAYRTLSDAYNAGLTPVVPTLGSMGEGDVTLLAHMGYALQGHGRMWRPDGRIVAAGHALKSSGIPKLRLQARDGLALIGSNAYAAALVIEALSVWRRVRHAAVPVAALSFIAWRANPSALLEQVLRLVSPAVAGVGHEIWSWLADTPLTPRDIQDPLSWRCTPHVLGAADQAAQQLAHSVESLVQTPRDNPVVLSTGDVLSNGNFDVTELVLGVDTLRNALVRVIAQQAQRVAKLLNHHYSGLTPGLAHRFGDAGLGLLDFNVSALVTEAQSLAQGPLLQWGEVAAGVEDYGTMVSAASLRLLNLVGVWQTMTATEWVTAARGVEIQKIGVVGPLADIAQMVDPLERHSHLTPHERMHRMEETIARGALPNASFHPSVDTASGGPTPA